MLKTLWFENVTTVSSSNWKIYGKKEIHLQFLSILIVLEVPSSGYGLCSGCKLNQEKIFVTTTELIWNLTWINCTEIIINLWSSYRFYLHHYFQPVRTNMWKWSVICSRVDQNGTRPYSARWPATFWLLLPGRTCQSYLFHMLARSCSHCGRTVCGFVSVTTGSDH